MDGPQVGQRMVITRANVIYAVRAGFTAHVTEVPVHSEHPAPDGEPVLRQAFAPITSLPGHDQGFSNLHVTERSR